MTEMLPLDPPEKPRVPTRLREHKVHTLPALLAALQDLVRFATDKHNAGPINLADFDPLHGVTVSLNDYGDGLFGVRFQRNRADGKRGDGR